MFYQRVILVCMASALGALSSGCEIHNCEENAICLDEDESATNQCSALCRHLVDCGRIDADQRASCMDECVAGFKHDDDALEEYGECSAETSCRELTRECGRPPFTLPPPADEEEDDDDDGKAHTDAGADSGNDPSNAEAGAGPHTAADAGVRSDAGGDAGPRPPDAAAGICTCDDDCAQSEGCLNGTCRARCQASCECRLGDVCESGLCVTPPPVGMSCQSDCDCPAGNHCVASMCSAVAVTLL